MEGPSENTPPVLERRPGLDVSLFHQSKLVTELRNYCEFTPGNVCCLLGPDKKQKIVFLLEQLAFNFFFFKPDCNL